MSTVGQASSNVAPSGRAHFGREVIGRAARLLSIAVPVAFLGLFVGWPLLAIMVRGFDQTSISDLFDVVARPATRRVLWFTTWQAFVSALLTLVVGLPMAQVIGRFHFRGRLAFRSFVVVPFVLPTVVVAAAIRAAGVRLGIDVESGVPAVLAAHVFFNVAVVVRIVGGFWATLDRRQVDAARVLGASPFEAWRTVTARQLAPVLAGSFLLVFLFSFTSYGVIRVLGGLRLATVETEIYRYAVPRGELDVAAVLSLLQLAVVVVLAASSAAFQRRHVVRQRQRSQLTPVSSTTDRVQLAVAMIIAAVVIGIPVFSLIERSLSVGDGYRFDHYAALAQRVDLLPMSGIGALFNSLRFALLAAVVAGGVGVLGSVAVVRGGKTGRALEALSLLPLGVSAVTLGFGYILAFTVLDLRRSSWLIPVAHAVIGFPFVLASVVPALRSISPRLREAAATMGASPIQRWLTVDWPLARKAAATGAGFAAAVSFGEFGASSFLDRTESSFTAPIAIFRLLSTPGTQLRGQALALSVVVGLTVAAIAALIESRRGDGVSLL